MPFADAEEEPARVVAAVKVVHHPSDCRSSDAASLSLSCASVRVASGRVPISAAPASRGSPCESTGAMMICFVGPGSMGGTMAPELALSIRASR